jgi:hypothetical protein
MRIDSIKAVRSKLKDLERQGCRPISFLRTPKQEQYERLRAIRNFREISFEYCQKRKLCTTSSLGGKAHCGKKAQFVYDSSRKKTGKLYMCEECYWSCQAAGFVSILSPARIKPDGTE